MTLFRTENLIAQNKCRVQYSKLSSRLKRGTGDNTRALDNCNSEKFLRDCEIIEDMKMKSFSALYAKLMIEQSPKHKLKVLLPSMQAKSRIPYHDDIVGQARFLVVEDVLKKLSKTKDQVEGEKLSRLLDGEPIRKDQALVLFQCRMRLRV